MIDSTDESALTQLKEYLLVTQERLFANGPFVTDAAEWQTARRLAESALTSLRRPRSEKELWRG